MLFKRFFQIVAILAGLVLLGAVVVYGSSPWWSRWNAADDEVAATLPGDELVPIAAAEHITAITIQAPPERIFPWLLQIGAERGGYYSLTLIEGLIQCPITNADTIHPEWQNLQVGGEVKMCPGTFGPPPYEVAAIEPNRSLILGHRDEAGSWSEVWQFVLQPIDENSTRFLIRSRSTLSGGIWSVIAPGVFVMEQGLLNGVKTRAEQITTGQSLSGQVVWGNEPVAGATVYFGTGGWKMSGDEVLISAVTDEQGAFTLYTPPLGDYIMVAVWPDGAPSEAPVTPVRVYAGATQTDFEVSLAKPLEWLEPAGEAVTELTPTLKWGVLDGAAKYRVFIIDAGTTELIADKTVLVPSLMVTSPLTLGRTYTVEVQALSGEGGLLAKVTRQFTVEVAEP